MSLLILFSSSSVVHAKEDTNILQDLYNLKSLELSINKNTEEKIALKVVIENTEKEKKTKEDVENIVAKNPFLDGIKLDALIERKKKEVSTSKVQLHNKTQEKHLELNKKILEDSGLSSFVPLTEVNKKADYKPLLEELINLDKSIVDLNKKIESKETSIEDAKKEYSKLEKEFQEKYKQQKDRVKKIVDKYIDLTTQKELDNLKKEKMPVEPKFDVKKEEAKLEALRKEKMPSDNFVYPSRIRSVSSPFGYRGNPFGGKTTEFHSGTDFPGPQGTPIYAVEDGVVTHASVLGGYGNLIIVKHNNGLETRYAHLSGYKVEVGQRVTQGQTIGLMGTTGRSTGPHLHFEVRVNGTAVNPMEYLK